MLTVRVLFDGAYGAAIKSEIEHRLERKVSVRHAIFIVQNGGQRIPEGTCAREANATVGYQTARVALRNPSETLNYE